MPAARIIDANGFDDPEAEVEKKILEDIQNAFAESPGINWFVRVGMLEGKTMLRGGKEAFLFNCNVEDLPIDDRLRDVYGTGRYRARVYRENRVFKLIDMSIIAPPDQLSRRTAEVEGGSIMEAIRAMAENQNATLERLFSGLANTQPAPPAAVDPFAALERMTTIMANMRGMQPEAAPAVNPMDMFTKGLEFAQNMSAAASGGETTALDVLKEFVKSDAVAGAIGGFLQGKGAAPAAQLVPPVAPPPRGAGQVLPPVRPPQQAATAPEADTNALISQQIDYLISRAVGGFDPILSADFVYDNAPDSALSHILDNPNILTALAQINPAITNHTPWFEKLLERVRAIAQEENAAEPEQDNAPPSSSTVNNAVNSRGQGGNAGNTPNHARARTAV